MKRNSCVTVIVILIFTIIVNVILFKIYYEKKYYDKYYHSLYNILHDKKLFYDLNKVERLSIIVNSYCYLSSSAFSEVIMRDGKKLYFKFFYDKIYKIKNDGNCINTILEILEDEDYMKLNEYPEFLLFTGKIVSTNNAKIMFKVLTKNLKIAKKKYVNNKTLHRNLNSLIGKCKQLK